MRGKVATTGTILDTIVANTRADLDAVLADRARLELEALSAAPALDALASLTMPGVRVIAEVKRRSPSAGNIGTIADPVALASTYAAHGAAAISVLTEPHHFGGHLDDLRAVAAAVDVPVLRKDFIIDEVQILEARAAGASLILLIAALLDEATLRAFREFAEGLGMHALVEAHDRIEVERSLASGARILGINNRDLRTFEVDLANCERLRPMLDDAEVAVAESGVDHAGHVERLRASGYDTFLIGSALVRAEDPGAALSSLIEVGQ